MSSSQEQPVKWHALHCDPIMDVVLLSNDGICFRASSHALKRESSLFKSMFDTKPATYQTPAVATPLDFTAISIAAFLDRYITPAEIGLIQDPPASLLSVRDYRNLVRYLDCDRLLSQANAAWQTSCSRDPVAWFTLASSENDLSSAESALLIGSRVGSYSSLFKANTTALYKAISGTQVKWQLPLMRSLLGPLGRENTITIDWPDCKKVAQFVKEVEQARAQ